MSFLFSPYYDDGYGYGYPSTRRSRQEELYLRELEQQKRRQREYEQQVRRQREYELYQQQLELQRQRESEQQARRQREAQLRQRQQQQELLRQQQQRDKAVKQQHEKVRQQQLAAQAQKENQIRARKALFLRYTHAATVIQRAFRGFLARRKSLQHRSATIIQHAFRKYLASRTRKAIIIQRAFRQYLALRRAVQAQHALVIQRAYRQHLARRHDQAARIVTRALRNFQAQVTARRALGKIRTLHTLCAEIEALRAQKEEAILSQPVYAPGAKVPHKEFLVYEDALLKFLIKLDSVMSEGSDVVRDARKAAITRTQRLLTALDSKRNSEKAQS